ncbi:hypothetical protein MauCBS54593_000018 [Microsporum audouinii]
MAHKFERKEGSSSSNCSALLSPRTQPTEYSLGSDDACPSFWAPGDRPGHKGLMDQHRRKSRLTRSIRLDAKQLRHVLLFMQHNHSRDGIRWTPEILFSYVPRTFEDATTTEAIAAQALFHAITPSLAAIFKTTHSNVLSLNTSPRYIVFEFFWHGSPPVVPQDLRDLPNIKLTREEPEEIYPDTIKSGSKIIVPDPLSLNLNSTFSFGTVGYVAVIEELGERRLVLVTAGHVVDDARTIRIQDEEQEDNIYQSQIVPEFERIGGVPLFRRGEPINPLPASLNETCLLETDQIPRSALRRVGEHVDCNRLNPDPTINDSDDSSLSAFDPKLGDIGRLRQFLLEEEPVQVYKYGAASSYTTGFLRQIRQDDHEENLYRLKVQWTSAEEPFAEEGDSGSLVFAKDGDYIIPLGIHCGSRGTTSYSLSLWSICEDISTRLDADLFFCGPNDLPHFDPSAV